MRELLVPVIVRVAVLLVLFAVLLALTACAAPLGYMTAAEPRVYGPEVDCAAICEDWCPIDDRTCSMCVAYDTCNVCLMQCVEPEPKRHGI